MKYYLFIVICFCIGSNYVCFSQTNHHLYYFIHKKDSLVGVKDDKGNIIISPIYLNLRFEDNEKIPDNATLIIMEKYSGTKGKPARSAGDAFDRNGNFLFHPLNYDNGPDYFSEGLARCVENDKVGFVNRKGKTTIKPQWDWSGGFNYGYAFVCNGCYFDYSKDSEHPDLAFRPNHESYYIDRNGIKTDSLKINIDSILDYKAFQGSYYPYPFKYDAKEQNIVDSFNNKRVLKHIAKGSYQVDANDVGSIRFEITNRPDPEFPYYEVQGYKNQYNEDDLIFLVDKAGNWFHYDSWRNEIMNFNKWLSRKR